MGLRVKIRIKKRSDLVDKIVRRLSNPDKYGLWDRVADFLESFKERMFRSAKTGQAGYGRDSWAPISEWIYDDEREGTDGGIYGFYRDRPDEPLIASGAYLNSFGQISVPRPTMLVWGSKHKLADQIPHAGLGNRYALPDASDSSFRADSADVLQIWLSDMLEEVKA